MGEENTMEPKVQSCLKFANLAMSAIQANMESITTTHVPDFYNK